MSSNAVSETKRFRWWAVELLRKGKYKHATVLALHCYKQSFFRSNTVELLESVLLLGKCLCKQNMFKEALRCAQDAQEYVRDNTIGSEVAGEAFWAIGGLYSDVGHFSEANACFQQHCQITETVYGPDHIRCSDAHSIISCLLAKQGKLEEGLDK